jgi:hypothetical protein
MERRIDSRRRVGCLEKKLEMNEKKVPVVAAQLVTGLGL